MNTSFHHLNCKKCAGRPDTLATEDWFDAKVCDACGTVYILDTQGKVTSIYKSTEVLDLW